MYYNTPTYKLVIMTWQSPLTVSILIEYQFFRINEAANLSGCGIKENKAMCHKIHSFGHHVTTPKRVGESAYHSSSLSLSSSLPPPSSPSSLSSTRDAFKTRLGFFGRFLAATPLPFNVSHVAFHFTMASS